MLPLAPESRLSLPLLREAKWTLIITSCSESRPSCLNSKLTFDISRMLSKLAPSGVYVAPQSNNSRSKLILTQDGSECSLSVKATTPEGYSNSVSKCPPHIPNMRLNSPSNPECTILWLMSLQGALTSPLAFRTGSRASITFWLCFIS